jgi:7-cyano-7-deazaguanine synthase
MAHHLEMLRQVSPVQRVEPYSTLLWTAHGGLTVGKLPLEQPLDALVVASGGLDSTVAAAKLVRQGRRVCLLHFHYGCRAQEREWARVVLIGAELGADVAVITLPDVFGRHGLNGEDHITAGVAGSEYAHEWVPARNLVMLSTAVAYAEAHGFGSVALGNNLEEAGAYPDNEEQFILDMDRAVQLATQNGRRVRIVQPVGHLMKHEIVKLGLELKAPLEHTWSCYRGGERHCGECGPCFMRRTAFERNGAKDPVMP